MSIPSPSNTTGNSSLLNSLLALTDEERQALIQSLSPEQILTLRWDWEGVWARENQKPPPGDWRVFLMCAGRGFGKTRAGAEWVRLQAEQNPSCLIALVGQTAADVRDVMVRGPAGLLTISPPWFLPEYSPSNRLLKWPNGSEAHTYSGDEPDQLRGPAHHFAWCDEPAKWKYGEETWANLEMGMRLGSQPRIVATTTPRPTRFIKEMIADPMCVVVRGSSYENLENLPPVYIARLKQRYEGSRLGRQELRGEILEDREGALWKRGPMIEALRVVKTPDLYRIVVAVDPGIGDGELAAETGIIVAGKGEDGHGYVLEDASLRGSPHEWARAALAAYHRHKADRMVAEVNQGGEMVETTLRTVDSDFAYKAVRAARGKMIRAEPVSALYEQGRIHHQGTFPELEDQLCEYVPGEKSPDRLDALVWAMHELFDLGEEDDTGLGILAMGSARGWV